MIRPVSVLLVIAVVLGIAGCQVRPSPSFAERTSYSPDTALDAAAKWAVADVWTGVWWYSDIGCDVIVIKSNPTDVDREILKDVLFRKDRKSRVYVFSESGQRHDLGRIQEFDIPMWKLPNLEFGLGYIKGEPDKRYTWICIVNLNLAKSSKIVFSSQYGELAASLRPLDESDIR